MRATALLRAGIACLLLAPLFFLAWVVSPSGTAAIAPGTGEGMRALMLGWGAIAPLIGLLLILAGGVLNVLAVRAGVRRLERVASGAEPMGAGSVERAGPRIRILDAQGREIGGTDDVGPVRAPINRRVVGGLLAVGLGILIAGGLVVLIAGIPAQLAPGIPLTEVYAAWGGVGSSGFIVGVVLWAVLAVLLTLAVAVVGLRRGAGLDRLVPAHRFIALALVIGSVIVVASGAPAFVVAQELGDVFALDGATTTTAGWLLGQLGIAFSVGAILVTVPRWRARRRPAVISGASD